MTKKSPHVWGNPRQSWILYSKLSISGFWIPIVRVSGFLEVYPGFQSQGFWIPQVKFSRRIQDSTNNNFQDSGFHKQKFPGYRNPLNVGKERKATKNIPVAEDLNSIIDCFFNPVVFFVMLYKVTHIYQFFRQEDDYTTWWLFLFRVWRSSCFDDSS